MLLANIRNRSLDDNEEFGKQRILTNECFGILRQ